MQKVLAVEKCKGQLNWFTVYLSYAMPRVIVGNIPPLEGEPMFIDNIH